MSFIAATSHRLPTPRLRGVWLLLLALFAAGSLAPTSAQAATVGVGFQHTCVIAEGGTPYCWGSNDSGQLGNGSAADVWHYRPAPVPGINTATEIAVTRYSTCVLIEDHTVRCWGAGSLGNGTHNGSPTPVQTSGLTDAIAIAAVGYNYCALRLGGRVSCWGRGFGDTKDPFVDARPRELEGVVGALDVTGNYAEVCIVWADQTKCLQTRPWGQQAFDGAERPASANIQQLGSTAWAINDGCAVLASGQVGCWGIDNRFAQFGDGTVGDPRPRGYSLVAGISDARTVVTHWMSSCALHHNGQVSCWGSKTVPVPGRDAVALVTTPIVREDLKDIVALTGSDDKLCATTADQDLKCWPTDRYDFNGGVNDKQVPATTVEGIKVAVSARDAVTPVRRGEPDITVPAWVPPTSPEPTTPTTPEPTTPSGTTPSPTTPSGTTPWGTTPVGTTPGTGGIGDGTVPPLALPTILLKRGVVILADHGVAPLKSGRCPKQARVTVRSGRLAMTRTVGVGARNDGRCIVNGSVRLGRRLGKARRITVTVMTPGGLRTVRTLTKTA